MLPRMSVIDIVIAIVFLGCILYGVIRGFVRIAIGIAGLAATLAIAFRLAERGPEWFGGVFSAPGAARFAAFLAVLAAGLLLTAIASWLARRVLEAASLDWIDRVAGATVGIVGALLLVCAMLVGLTVFLPAGSTLLTGSRLVPIVMGVTDATATILPPQMAEVYRERRDALRKRLPEAPRA